ncbi:hypothetical protein HOLleu_34518 [Holothuria leucospilota]|uniref:Uncharacterized protein n=1 Tax=Holothuria leucospilota TaxID=206669 RepID=A0A9Q1BGA6_HOLLE|nr:hypothetical protein HOLleu_34518 [Holothuria leucospilota]
MAGAIVAGAIVAGFIVAGAIVAGAIVAGFIVAGAIVAGFIVAGAIVADVIVAGAICSSLRGVLAKSYMVYYVPVRGGALTMCHFFRVMATVRISIDSK